MHVICDCTAALTEAFEDVEVEGSQNVTVHNGYVRPNSLRIHAAFSHWNHFGSLTLLLGQVEGRAIFFWSISDASTSSYSFLFCITLAPNLFSSSALPHLSPTSPSAFHPDFKACLSLSLPAFPPWVISAFKLLTCEVHISLPIPLLTHGSSSSLPLPSRLFTLLFPNHRFLWSLLNFCPQCSLPKAFMIPSLPTDPQHTLAQSCCLSCSIGTSNLRNLSGFSILPFFIYIDVNSHHTSCSDSPPLSSETLSSFVLAGWTISLCQHLLLLTFLSFYGELLVEILQQGWQHQFQIHSKFSVYIPFLNSLKKNSVNYPI